MTPQFRKLMHVHLADQYSKIGSSVIRQFVINAFPMLLLKVFEFKLFQLRDEQQKVFIFGQHVKTTNVLLFFAFCTFILSPLAIGRSNRARFTQLCH